MVGLTGYYNGRVICFHICDKSFEGLDNSLTTVYAWWAKIPHTRTLVYVFPVPGGPWTIASLFVTILFRALNWFWSIVVSLIFGHSSSTSTFLTPLSFCASGKIDERSKIGLSLMYSGGGISGSSDTICSCKGNLKYRLDKIELDTERLGKYVFILCKALSVCLYAENKG